MQSRNHFSLKYLLGPFKFFFHLKHYAGLIKTLKPFRNYPLIKTRTRFIYLFSYISRALSTKDKLDILTYHYGFLQQAFPAFNLSLLFGEGIECWRETVNGEDISVKMMHSSYLEFEGSLSLLFFMNDTCIYSLAFTIVPGRNAGLPDDRVIFISRLQGTVGEVGAISRATKNLNDLIPPTILMSVLEGIALSIGIKKMIGICAGNQVSSGRKIAERYFDNYDVYWQSQGGLVIKDGNYLFYCPMQSKPIELMKAKHRNRTIAKRAKRAQIAAKSFAVLARFVNPGYRIA